MLSKYLLVYSELNNYLIFDTINASYFGINSINSAMANWGDNVKFLRKHRQLSQEAMAKDLQITRSKLNAHENGHTLNPPVEDLLMISQYFNISIDHLLKTNISNFKNGALDKLTASNEAYAQGDSLRILAITVDVGNTENVEYIPVKAKAGYRAGYCDPDYIAALPKYSFPDLVQGKTHRMFPTEGDSMLPIPEGSDILASYVQDWTKLKPDSPCIVIFESGNEFVFKNVTVQKNGNVLLKSTNEIYEPYTARASQILEIWQFERYISRDIPQAPTEINELKTMLLDMKKQLKLK